MNYYPYCPGCKEVLNNKNDMEIIMDKKQYIDKALCKKCSSEIEFLEVPGVVAGQGWCNPENKEVSDEG